MRPPIDFPPMKSGSDPTRLRAASIASRHAASSTGARSGALRPAVMYGKSNVAAVMPRSASAVAPRTRNGLVCPAPAPCATISAATALPAGYTFTSTPGSIAPARTVGWETRPWPRACRFPSSAFFCRPFRASGSGFPADVTPQHYDIRVEPDLAAATFAAPNESRSRSRSRPPHRAERRRDRVRRPCRSPLPGGRSPRACRSMPRRSRRR